VVQQPSEMMNGRLKMSRHDLMVLDEVMADLMRIWIHVDVPFFELPAVQQVIDATDSQRIRLRQHGRQQIQNLSISAYITCDEHFCSGREKVEL
jgi:hypothetical protein